MAQQIVNDGDSGLVARNKWNTNFSELYGFATAPAANRIYFSDGVNFTPTTNANLQFNGSALSLPFDSTSTQFSIGASGEFAFNHAATSDATITHTGTGDLRLNIAGAASGKVVVDLTSGAGSAFEVHDSSGSQRFSVDGPTGESFFLNPSVTALYSHVSTAVASTSNVIRHSDFLNIAGGPPTEASRIEITFSDIGALTNDSRIVFSARKNNVLNETFQILGSEGGGHLASIGDVIGTDDHSGLTLAQAVPAAGNYTLLSDGDNLFINTPSDGAIIFRENNNGRVTFSSSFVADTFLDHFNQTTASTANSVRKSDFLKITSGALVEATRIASNFTDIGNTTNDSQISIFARQENSLNETVRIIGAGVNQPISIGDVINNIGFVGITLHQTTPTISNYAILSDGTDLDVNTPTGGKINFRENNLSKFTISAEGTDLLFNSVNNTAFNVSNTIHNSGYLFVANGARESSRIETQLTDIGSSTNDSTLTFYTRINDTLAARVKIDSDGILKTAAGVPYGTGSTTTRSVARTAVNTNTAAMGLVDFYVVTDTTAARTIEVSNADVADGRTFIFSDETGAAGTNNITIKTADIAVTAVVTDGASGTRYTSTAHGLVNGSIIEQSGFSEATYNDTDLLVSGVTANTYDIATIAFVTDISGTANRGIEGKASINIVANYGGLRIRGDDKQNLIGW